MQASIFNLKRSVHEFKSATLQPVELDLDQMWNLVLSRREGCVVCNITLVLMMPGSPELLLILNSRVFGIVHYSFIIVFS